MSITLNKPIFFNSAIVLARERLVLQTGALLQSSFNVRWGLLPKTSMGPCVIDTGYTPDVTKGVERSLGLKTYARLLQPKLLECGQLQPALYRYGLQEDDVAGVIITHFHADHISGLCRFRNAQIYVSQLTMQQLSNTSKLGLWLKGIFPELLPPDLAERARFIETFHVVEMHGIKTYDLFGDGQCLALPLPGHARGHFGLIFPQEKLIYAVDCHWVLKAFDLNEKPTRFTTHIIDNNTQSIYSMNLIRRLMSYGYEVMLCHEPSIGAYDV